MNKALLLLSFLVVALAGSASAVDYVDWNPVPPITDVSSWAGDDVAVKAVGDSSSVVVEGAAAGTAESLTVTGGASPTDHDAEITFKQPGKITIGDVTITGDAGEARMLVDSGGKVEITGMLEMNGTKPHPTLPGVYVPTAKVTVSNNGTLTVKRANPLDPSAYAGIHITDGLLEIDSHGTVTTEALAIDGGLVAGNVAGTEVTGVMVGADGSLVVDNNKYMVTVSNGVIDVAAGAGRVYFAGGATIGNRGSLNLDSDLELGDTADGIARRIRIEEGGTMTVGGNVTVSSADGSSYIYNQAGLLTVESGASLTADMIWSDGATVIEGVATAPVFMIDGGTTTLRNSGRVEVQNASHIFSVMDGAVSVEAGSSIFGAGQFAISGGRLDLAGTLSVSAVNVSGGVVDSTGAIVANRLSVTGGETTLRNGSTAAATDFAMSGSSTFTLAEGAGLNVSGSFSVAAGTFNMAENLVTPLGTGGFALDGGRINLQNGKTLTVRATGSPLSMGGGFYFQSGNAVFADDLTFVNGGLFVDQSTPASLTLTNNSLAFTRSGTLDVTKANLAISGVTDFGFDGGTYIAGWNATAREANRAVVDMSATGQVSITGRTTVKMDNALQRQAQDRVRGGGEILILETNGVNGTGSQISWEDNFYTYYYALKQVGGVWGLYVYDVTEVGADERLAEIYRLWNRDPRVAGHADKLINPGFANSIIEGRRMQVSVDYDSLSPSGQFNADVLASLGNRAAAVEYDALMLYNGSGLAQASRAVLAANDRTIGYLGRRNAMLRREMAENGETLDPCATLASAFTEEALKNRVWAAATYISDRQQWDEGFAGYRYRGRGVMVGADRLFGDFAAGAAVSYLGGDFDDVAARGNDSTIDNYAFSLYGTYSHNSGLFVTGAVGAGHASNKIHDRRFLRGVEGWNDADYKTRSWLAAASVGYDWYPTEHLVVTPSFGISHVAARAGAHEQYFIADNGIDSAATINAGRVKNRSTTLPLELAVGYDVVADDESVLSMNANFGYAYQLRDKGAQGTIGYSGLGFAPVAIASHSPDRHNFTIGAGAKYMTGRFEMGVKYDYAWRTQFRSHALTGTFGVNF